MKLAALLLLCAAPTFAQDCVTQHPRSGAPYWRICSVAQDNWRPRGIHYLRGNKAWLLYDDEDEHRVAVPTIWKQVPLRKAANRTFWKVTAFQLAAATLDVVSTRYAMHRGGREANPLLGQSAAQQIGVSYGMAAAATIVSLLYKREEMENTLNHAPNHGLKWKTAVILPSCFHLAASVANFAQAAGKPVVPSGGGPR